MVSNLITRITLLVGAVLSLLVAVKTYVTSKRKERVYEDTIELSNEIRDVQLTGDVRDRMYRAGWIKPDKESQG